MNNLSKNNFLVTNSKEESIFFQIGSNDEIEYTFLNQNYEPTEINKLFENQVLKYAVTIDKSDRIHLVHLSKSGELKYSIFENNNWSTATIAIFDLRSNIYDNIVVLPLEDSIHIIYAYANLINSKLWTIHHVAGDYKQFEQYNAVKFASDRTPVLFAVDKDLTDSIQLLYIAKVNDTDQIYHTFFNPFTKKWNPTPQKLTISNYYKQFPYIFVDSNNNIHSLWLEKLDTSYILKYSRLMSSENRSNSWKEVKIPYINDCNNAPIIIEEQGILKIIYSVDNGISYLYSLDHGSTWYKEDTCDIKSNEINLVKISSIAFKTNNTKINDIYCSIKDRINFFFSDNFNSISLNPIETNLSKELDTSNQPVKELEVYNIKIEELLKIQEEIKDILSNILDSQKMMEESIKNLLQIIETKKGSFINRLIK